MKKFSEIIKENEYSLEDYIIINQINTAFEEDKINEGVIGKTLAVIGGLVAAGVAGMAKFFKWLFSETKKNVKEHNGRYVVEEETLKSIDNGKHLDKYLNVSMMSDKDLNKFLELTNSTSKDGPFYNFYKSLSTFGEKAPDDIKTKIAFAIMYGKDTAGLIYVTTPDEKTFFIEFIDYYDGKNTNNKAFWKIVRNKMIEVLKKSYKKYELLCVRTKNGYDYFTDLEFNKKLKAYTFKDIENNTDDNSDKIQKDSIEVKEISKEDFEKIAKENEKNEEVKKSIDELKDLEEPRIILISNKENKNSIISWAFIYSKDNKIEDKTYNNNDYNDKISDEAKKFVKEEYDKLKKEIEENLKNNKEEDSNKDNLKELANKFINKPEELSIVVEDCDIEKFEKWINSVKDEDVKNTIIKHQKDNNKCLIYLIKAKDNSVKESEDKKEDKFTTIGCLLANKEKNKLHIEYVGIILPVKPDTKFKSEILTKDIVENNKKIFGDNIDEITYSENVKGQFNIKDEEKSSSYIPEDVINEIEGDMKDIALKTEEIKDNSALNDIVDTLKEKDESLNFDEIIKYQKDHSKDDIFKIKVVKDKNEYIVGFVFLGKKIDEAKGEKLEIYVHKIFSILNNKPGEKFKEQLKETLNKWADDSDFEINWGDKNEEENTDKVDHKSKEVKKEINKKSKNTIDSINKKQKRTQTKIDNNEQIDNKEAEKQKQETKELTDEQKEKIKNLKQECKEKLEELDKKYTSERKGKSLAEYDEIIEKMEKEAEEIKKEYNKKIEDIISGKSEENTKQEETKEQTNKKESTKDIEDTSKGLQETPKQDKTEEAKNNKEKTDKEIEKTKKEASAALESKNPYEDVEKNIKDKLQISLALFSKKQKEFNNYYELWKNATVNNEDNKAKEYEKKFNKTKNELDLLKIELNKYTDSLKKFKNTDNVLEGLDVDNLDWKLDAWFNRDSNQRDLFNRVLNDPTTLEIALADGFDMQGLVNFTYDNVKLDKEIDYVYQLEQLLKFLKEK